MSWFRGLGFKSVTMLAIITFFFAISFPASGHAARSNDVNDRNKVESASLNSPEFSRNDR